MEVSILKSPNTPSTIIKGSLPLVSEVVPRRRTASKAAGPFDPRWIVKPGTCSTGNQPEGYPCHGCQFLARPQCGAGSRDTVPTAGNAAEHLRIRHHNGRDNGYSGKSADSYQGVILFYFRHGLHGISRIYFVLYSFGQHYLLLHFHEIRVIRIKSVNSV